MAADLPPDPLLSSGSFIDPNNLSPSNGDRPQATNGDALHGTPRSGAAAAASSADSKNRRRAALQGDYSWLPPGWVVEDRVRTSGATAGTIDKYYFGPTSGRRFRSKKEVLDFIENGATPKKRKPETGETDKDNSKSSPGSKKKKPASKKTCAKFDSANPPLEVSWVLTDGDSDTWDAWLGEEKVAKSTKEGWIAAFTSQTTKGIAK